MKSQTITRQTTSTQSSHIHNIDSVMLSDSIVDGEPRELYLGRGSFGIVELQNYHGINVAVKELPPRTLKADLMQEAQILSLLCHPNLPCLFGVCATSLPLRIVMQFHGINLKARSLWQELEHSTVQKESPSWILLFAQTIEAMRYLHDEVMVLHNDITPCNIMMSESTSHSDNLDYQLVVIDFGKAT